MPRIFDNISEQLQTALIQTLHTTQRADFCVGYFNLCGWGLLQSSIDPWQGGVEHQCRLLIGTHHSPQEDIRTLFSLVGKLDNPIDNQQLVRLRRQIIEDFRKQLMIGAPTNDDEQCLRALARQLREGKLVVKLFLRYLLHAKRYLLQQPQIYSAPIPVNPQPSGDQTVVNNKSGVFSFRLPEGWSQ